MNSIAGDSGNNGIQARQVVPAQVGPAPMDLVEKISRILNFVCFENSNIVQQKTSVFYLDNNCPIQLDTYIRRLLVQSRCRKEPLILATYYILLINREDQGVVLTSRIHKLFLASFVIANKFLEDKALENSDLSRAGGVPKNELNTLEYEFFKLLKFNGFVSEERYDLFLGWFNNAYSTE